MSYKILHLPTATYLYECTGVSFTRGAVPILAFEVSNPDDKKYFQPLVLETKKEAEKIIPFFINMIKTQRGLYRTQPEAYSCCLNKIFYSIERE